MNDRTSEKNDRPKVNTAIATTIATLDILNLSVFLSTID